MRQWIGLDRATGAVLIFIATTSAAAPPGSTVQAPPTLPVHSQVAGGTAVPSGGWPDCAAVENVYTGNLCTGVLVSPDLVLTAAHCLAGPVSDIVVELGWTDKSQPPVEEDPVVWDLTYPNWQTTYDVGILRLPYPSKLPPRLIAHGCAAADYLDGAPVELVGWGATDTYETTFPTTLMEASTTINDADCSDLSLGCRASVSPGGELAAGGDGVDMCIGDSGGPLYLLDPPTPLLGGIRSRALDTATVPCGDGSIYVRADAIIAWIEAETSETLPAPVCDSGLIFSDSFESGSTSSWSTTQGAAPTSLILVQAE